MHLFLLRISLFFNLKLRKSNNAMLIIAVQSSIKNKQAGGKKKKKDQTNSSKVHLVLDVMLQALLSLVL